MSDQSIVEVTDKRASVTPADREAWIEYEDYDGAFADRIRTGSEDNTSGLQMFARYAENARIAEREACAIEVEKRFLENSELLAAAIRARS
jgi:hypothetical protein